MAHQEISLNTTTFEYDFGFATRSTNYLDCNSKMEYYQNI